MRRFLPERITIQIGLLLVLCVVLFHIATSSILLFLGPHGSPGEPRFDAALAAIAALNAADRDDRAAIATAVTDTNTGLRISLDPRRGELRDAASPPVDYLRSRLPPSVRIGMAGNASPSGLRIALADGQELGLDIGRPDRSPTGLILISIGFVAISLIIFSVWAAASLTRPLRRFADAAEAFSFDTDPAPLGERGSREVRSAARAFNRMQVRISTMAAAQGRTLAAISHDLRTPITRMRLRAEFIEDGDTRTRLMRDIEHMDGMVHACLSYLRGGAKRNFQPVEVTSLMQTVADLFTEMDANVTFAGGEKIVVMGNPDDLVRAVSNLTDNAVKYSGRAKLSVSSAQGKAVLEVADPGPGIPVSERSAMLEPFERGAQNRPVGDRDGYGLGLAITRAIAEAHSGSLVLADGASGFTARLVLPKAV